MNIFKSLWNTFSNTSSSISFDSLSLCGIHLYTSRTTEHGKRM